MPADTIDELLADARARLERLAPAEAADAMRDGALLVDTRDQAIRDREGTIPGSVHVPWSVLYWRLDPTSRWCDPALTDQDRRVIVMCSHGFSSSLAAATLQQLGFGRATDLAGGFEAWRDAGLPVEPPARPHPPRDEG
jgi:rhodanese-related sulfurtransferase